MRKENEQNGLKVQWERKAEAYNSIFNFLKECGLSKKKLIYFSKLLAQYNDSH